MITFLAYYPHKKDEKDGMMQRVLNVDEFFKEHSRQYIDIGLRRKDIKKHELLSNKLNIYRLNIFFDLILIIRLIKKSKIIYVHSIYNVRFSFLILFLLGLGKKTVLDVHGVVPEENLLLGKKIAYYKYSIIEYFTFRLISGIIYVTDVMKKHYDLKYPWSSNIPSIVYNIYPNFPMNYIFSEQYEGSKTIVIYSGNCQKWQNVDMILEIIKKNRNEHIEYVILTGEPLIFEKKINELGIVKGLWNLSVLSVKPSELPQYYSKAHYGFILRDDILVNQVANPTKMLEYLIFGIIPIVKSPKIGDFALYNYDYVLYTDFHTSLRPQKSSLNVDIAKKILIKKEELSTFVFGMNK